MLLLKLLIVATLVFILTPSAYSEELVTPLAVVNNGQFADCIVTNIDDKPVNITVQLIDFSGNTATATPTPFSCSSTLAAHSSCEALLPANTKAFCTVTASGANNVRVSMSVFDPAGNLVTLVPATRK